MTPFVRDHVRVDVPKNLTFHAMLIEGGFYAL
jgi:hypothetical protein